MMTKGFAGSNGLMDVPAPDWIVNNECLFAHWGSFLLAMIKHGSIETLHKTECLELATLEFGLLIDGDGVDVFSRRAVRDIDAFLARLGDQLLNQVMGTHGAFVVDDAGQGLLPFMGFLRVRIGDFGRRKDFR